VGERKRKEKKLQIGQVFLTLFLAAMKIWSNCLKLFMSRSQGPSVLSHVDFPTRSNLLTNKYINKNKDSRI
jgi:hypothetical protein